MTYYIIQHPPKTATKNLYTASHNASGYVKDGELHLTDGNLHYVYKYDQSAWFMRNEATGVDYPLGEGASPTLNIDDIAVKSTGKAYWESINFTPANEEAAIEE